MPELKQLEDRLRVVEEKLDRVLHILDTEVSRKCDKMEKHIDFVETVYASVRRPLRFVCNQFGGGDDHPAPNRIGGADGDVSS